mgnify:CR=1 FL=1
MAVNKFFQSGRSIGTTSEQRLYEDLVIEAIKIHGMDLYVIPRTVVKHDTVFGEDVLSQYRNAIPVEMYLENFEGWDGKGDIFAKFGIQVVDKATFIVSKRRWEETVRENASNLQLNNRPAEGDLVYFPLTNSTFEIMKVHADKPFFQLGTYFVFTLECQLFQYSSESFTTGIPEIDDDFLARNGNELDFSNFLITDSDNLADNITLQDEADEVLDFTRLNPFGEV